MKIAAELMTTTDEQKRKTARIPVSLRTGFRKRGYDVAKADLLDISPEGFKIDTSMTLGPGVEVWLKLPGLEPKPAVVMWVDDYTAGCKFLTPFHEAVLDQFLARNAA